MVSRLLKGSPARWAAVEPGRVQSLPGFHLKKITRTDSLFVKPTLEIFSFGGIFFFFLHLWLSRQLLSQSEILKLHQH